MGFILGFFASRIQNDLIKLLELIRIVINKLHVSSQIAVFLRLNISNRLKRLFVVQELTEKLVLGFDFLHVFLQFVFCNNVLGHCARDRQKRFSLEVVSALVQIANYLNGVLELVHFDKLSYCLIFMFVINCH